MSKDLTRRGFIGVAGVGAVAATTATVAAEDKPKSGPIKIVGIACSFRKGKSTAQAVARCLEDAKAVDPKNIGTELIDLADLEINAAVTAGIELKPGRRDDFPAVAAKLSQPNVAGMIIGTPVYFSNMSSLCKAFLERLMVFRKDNFALSNMVAGVLAVGGARNGGQELTVESVKTSLYAQEMIIVGESRPTAHYGPAVWNKKGFKSVTDDEVGMKAVANLGRRVAEVARLVQK
ncbi:MAG: flavodoxin family protein [Planctomycetota bacterium]|nr:flavodoxin family protein [Planctomycetota bacterium]